MLRYGRNVNQKDHQSWSHNFDADVLQLRSLKYVLLPSDSTPGNATMQTIARGQRARRTQFLFVYSYVVQFAFMWWLSALDVRGVPSART